jgi:UPF0755 protein
VSRGRRHLLRAGVMLAAGAAGWLTVCAYYLATPLDITARTQTFHVTRGETLGHIGRRLAESGLVSPHAPLALWGRMVRADRQIHPGSYMLSAAETPLDLLKTLVSGRAIPIRVTLPEGLTGDAILERLASAVDLPLEQLRAAASDTVWLRSLGLPGSVEGYLFPDTYFFDSGVSPRSAIERLVRTGEERIDAPRLARAAALGMTRHQLLTLASIVEAESALPLERRRIAAVYRNRLRLGWPLQADPTVAYGAGRSGRKLTEADLAVDSPYNTYLHVGLPPGPICSPGMTSIDAVLWPLDGCEDLYFVARGDGGHIFSRTLREHNLARRLISAG